MITGINEVINMVFLFIKFKLIVYYFKANSYFIINWDGVKTFIVIVENSKDLIVLDIEACKKVVILNMDVDNFELVEILSGVIFLNETDIDFIYIVGKNKKEKLIIRILIYFIDIERILNLCIYPRMVNVIISNVNNVEKGNLVIGILVI